LLISRASATPYGKRQDDYIQKNPTSYWWGFSVCSLHERSGSVCQTVKLPQTRTSDAASDEHQTKNDSGRPREDTHDSQDTGDNAAPKANTTGDDVKTKDEPDEDESTATNHYVSLF